MIKNIKFLATLLLFKSINGFTEYRDEPFKEFDATRNIANKSLIVWRQEADVNSACDYESRKRGNSGFGFRVQGCSFYTLENKTSICTILTPQATTLTNLGHEVRHCFQGSWHGY